MLHLLGECNAFSVKRLSVLGSTYLSYEELYSVRWLACSSETCKDLRTFLTHQGMWGCALGPLEASSQTATSPHKAERKQKKCVNVLMRHMLVGEVLFLGLGANPSLSSLHSPSPKKCVPSSPFPPSLSLIHI